MNRYVSAHHLYGHDDDEDDDDDDGDINQDYYSTSFRFQSDSY